MHCRSCGNETEWLNDPCPHCGVLPLSGRHFCQECGGGTNPQAVLCISCGVPLKTQGLSSAADFFNSSGIVEPSEPAQSPWMMALLSLIVPGLGQILLGQIIKGLTILIITLALLPLCIGLFVFPLAAVDAYTIAKKLRDGNLVRNWEFF